MTHVRVEIEGGADEVVRVLRQLGSEGHDGTVGDAAGTIETLASSDEDALPVTVTKSVVESQGLAPVPWTESLAGDFLAELEPMARHMALHVWRAGAAGIHRSVLCQRTGLTPAELRSLLMRMGHALRRFQRERGMTLSRPVAANSPLQSYFVDLDFAAAANAQMFGDGMPDRLVNDRLADGAGRP